MLSRHCVSRKSYCPPSPPPQHEVSTQSGVGTPYPRIWGRSKPAHTARKTESCGPHSVGKPWFTCPPGVFLFFFSFLSPPTNNYSLLLWVSASPTTAIPCVGHWLSSIAPLYRRRSGQLRRPGRGAPWLARVWLSHAHPHWFNGEEPRQHSGPGTCVCVSNAGPERICENPLKLWLVFVERSRASQ